MPVIVELAFLGALLLHWALVHCDLSLHLALQLARQIMVLLTWPAPAEDACCYEDSLLMSSWSSMEMKILMPKALTTFPFPFQIFAARSQLSWSIQCFQGACKSRLVR